MDTYTFSFVLGGVGLVAMAVAGAAHGGHGSHAHGGHTAHHGGPHHGPSHDVHVGPHAGHPAGHASAPSRETGVLTGLKSNLLPLMSPRVLFSALLGFGATGVLLRQFAGGVWLLLGAVIGALVLELVLIAPFWRFLLRFASQPAQTFDASAFSEARAASGFNASGEGLVAIEVDGQIVQCLGRLRDADRQLGIRVRTGDRLRVEEVDAARQRCTVSYVGHADAIE